MLFPSRNNWYNWYNRYITIIDTHARAHTHAECAGEVPRKDYRRTVCASINFGFLSTAIIASPLALFFSRESAAYPLRALFLTRELSGFPPFPDKNKPHLRTR